MHRTELTKGERLTILRRRSGKTQAQAARGAGLSLNAYRDREASEDPDGRPLRLSDAEFCYISRRRSGLTLDELAPKVELSKWWICQIEKGRAPAGTLLGYWTV